MGPPPIADVAVTQWDDKSGAGRHLGQATPALQPTFRFNTGINGLGSVDFQGAQLLDWLVADATLATMLQTTVFLVLTSDLGPAPDGPVLWGSNMTAVTSAWQIGGPDAPGLIAGENFTIGSNDLAAATSNADFVLGTNLFSITQNAIPGSNAMRVDGNPVTLSLGNPLQNLTPSAAVGGAGVVMLRMGADDLATTTYFDGLVAEAIIYDSELSTAEILAIECYLTLKWFT